MRLQNIITKMEKKGDVSQTNISAHANIVSHEVQNVIMEYIHNGKEVIQYLELRNKSDDNDEEEKKCDEAELAAKQIREAAKSNGEKGFKKQIKEIDNMIESIINNLIPMHYFPVFNSIDEPFSIDFEDVQKINKMQKYERAQFFKNKNISKTERFLLEYNPNKEQYYFMKNKARNIIVKSMFQHFYLISSQLTSDLFNDKQILAQCKSVMIQYASDHNKDQNIKSKENRNLLKSKTVFPSKLQPFKVWGVAKRRKIFDYNLMDDEYKTNDKSGFSFPNKTIELEEYYLK